MNKWIQLILVMVVTAVVRAIVVILLNIDPYTFTTPRMSEIIRLGEWGTLAYLYTGWMRNIINGVFFLRAAGVVEFIDID